MSDNKSVPENVLEKDDNAEDIHDKLASTKHSKKAYQSDSDADPDAEPTSTPKTSDAAEPVTGNAENGS